MTGRKTIYINQKYVGNTPRENEKIFSTFFHEKAHYYQEVKMKDATPDYKLLQSTKELLMYKKLVYGNKGIETSENYCKLGIECDANLRSIVDYISFFNSVNPDYLNSKYKLEKLEFKNILEMRDKLERKDLDTNVVYDVNAMFDNRVSKKDLIKCINIYPILLYEYHSNGEKKSVLELLGELNNLCYQKHKLDESGIDYNKSDIMRRIRTYRELIKSRQTFVAYNNKIICNSQEKFNDWIILLDALIEDPLNTQIIDYLIKSIYSFNEIATNKDKEVTNDIFKILNKKLFMILPDEIIFNQELTCSNFLMNLNQYRYYLNEKERLSIKTI